MTQYIDRQKLAAFGKSDSARLLENATQLAMVFQEPSLEPGQYNGLIDPQYVNKPYYSKLRREAPDLLDPSTLNALRQFHHDVLLEAGFLPYKKPTGRPVSKEQARLVYSCFAHMPSPTGRDNAEHRQGIKEAFEKLDLGTPLTPDEIVAQSGAIRAIASKTEKSHELLQ